ncbi:MAG: chromate transporter [Proteobacteria bacterium]|jgi:chromate transporter|nr:chromate transporter [Pseudomonadota bacterium]
MIPPPDDAATAATGRDPLAGVTPGRLFASFLKMGLLGFGGVLPWARRVVVDERGWLSDRDFAETMGLCQVLPGPNVVNLAVIIGSRSQGPFGALLAVTGILFVPIAVMLAMAIFYAEVAHHPLARHAIAAASAAAAGLIIGTAVRLFIKARPPLRGLLTGTAAFVAVGVLHWPLVWVALALMAGGVAAEWRAST